MRFTVLGSGSTGNAILIATEKTKVLVDAGLSCREIEKRLNLVGVGLNEIDAVVITHEHSDHVGGLRNLLGKICLPVYVSRPTEDAYYWYRRPNGNGADEGVKRRDALRGRTVEIESDCEFRIGDIDFDKINFFEAQQCFGAVAVGTIACCVNNGFQHGCEVHSTLTAEAFESRSTLLKRWPLFAISEP